MKVLLALGATFLIACQSAASTAPPPDDGADGLALRIAQPERIAGTYHSGATTLVFDTARSGDSLYIDLATGTGRELLHAETVGDHYVFRYLDRLTLTVDRAWVDAVRAEGDDGPAAADPTAAHWDGDMAVLDEMIGMPEMQALPWLSRTLGTHGITGSAYPASLALHKMARQSADANAIDLPPLSLPTAETEYCARPTADECYGMCGPGCTCWSWVCGDCCYHSGCAKHDSWCRNGQWYWCYNITAVVALFGC